MCRNPLRSFKNIENSSDDKFSPCLTPVKHGKKADVPSAVVTLDLILWYIFLMNLKHLPLTFVFESLVHNPSLQTVSKACLKSINVQ